MNPAWFDYFMVPREPHWHVPWDQLESRFEWIAAMRDVPQDPHWHAEGDVWIHTRMVCEQLVQLPAWRALPEHERALCWLATLLHDVAKPYCTREQDGRIRSPHHSPKGAVHGRRILWQAGVPLTEREQVCGLIRHHQLPLYALEGDHGERRVSAASLRCKLSHLALVAEADIRGRVSKDQGSQLEAIELFVAYAEELGCLRQPRDFASDLSRYMFFNGNRNAADEVFDDTCCTVTLMCGLPGSGKSHWCRHNASGQAVISLDAIRKELKVDPAENQGEVRRQARERAKAFLRKQQNFIWDATNLTRDRRAGLISLFRAYDARVEIVAIDADHDTLWRQNRERARTVPESIIRQMLHQWQYPDETEAHRVHRIEN